jgi:3-phosphoshikimate 1-carboxyvinyltransferase
MPTTPSTPLSAPFPVKPIDGAVTHTWPVPGSKSITNRALVLAALAEGTSVLDNVLESDDTAHMRTALARLGIAVRDGAPGQLLVDGGRSRLRPADGPLFIGNSGTTVRFLAALAALVPGATTLTGDAHMAKRPIADLVDGLRQLGVRVDCPTGCPPLTIHGGRLPGGTVTMNGDRSSQYFSALLLVAGLAEAEIRVEVAGDLVSRPYVEMTKRMVADFGGKIEDTADAGFRAHRAGSYRCRGYRVEPDASAASYPFALAAAGNHRITVAGLGPATLQGDYLFLEVLQVLGADISYQANANATTVSGTGRLTGGTFDMHHYSDTVMSLAAIAPLCSEPVTIINVANIRIKECDRLAACVENLTALGIRVENGADWLTVYPGAPRPATINTHHDHRLAMSFGVLGAIIPGVTIDDPACVAKTYPGFWDDLAACRRAARRTEA